MLALAALPVVALIASVQATPVRRWEYSQYFDLQGHRGGRAPSPLSQGPSNWLAGIDIDTFPGTTIGERVARAAAGIKADFLSLVGTSYASTGLDPAEPGWIPFTNASMVDTAHSLGLKVKTWTPNRKNLLEYLLDLGVDGVITDFPVEFRRALERKGYPLAPLNDKKRVLGCLATHLQTTSDKLDGKGYKD